MTASDLRLAEIEELYRRRSGAFVAVAAGVAGSRHAADAVQNAFVRAIRHRDAFRGDGPLESWLWRLVYNAACDLKASDRERLLGDNEPGFFPTQGGADADVAVWEAVGLLPERQRAVVFLRYFADLDYRSIAFALEVSPGTIAATLNAAHANVRTCLEEARCRV